ncbi:MAG: acylphosphatase [Chloroflexota bacterium]|nr:acylphosphatase [Chloroflexota bacterium]
MKRLHAVVTGRVQNVGFRDFVRREASARHLTGFVRNGGDGRSVEVVAEGKERALEELLDRLHTGPRFAVVQHVDVSYTAATGTFDRFSVPI